MKRKESLVAELREEAAKLRAGLETTSDAEARRQILAMVEELERRADELEGNQASEGAP